MVTQKWLPLMVKLAFSVGPTLLYSGIEGCTFGAMVPAEHDTINVGVRRLRKLVFMFQGASGMIALTLGWRRADSNVPPPPIDHPMRPRRFLSTLAATRESVVMVRRAESNWRPRWDGWSV